MQSHPAPEEQRPLEVLRERAESWWHGKSREEQMKTVWRLWLVVIGFIALIWLFVGIIPGMRSSKQNSVGREWVEQSMDEGAQNRDARGAIPSSAPGAQPEAGQPGVAQPGMGQPGMGRPGMGQPGAGQPGAGQPGAGQPAPGQPTPGQPSPGHGGAQGSPAGGRAYIPPTG